VKKTFLIVLLLGFTNVTRADALGATSAFIDFGVQALIEHPVMVVSCLGTIPAAAFVGMKVPGVVYALFGECIGSVTLESIAEDTGEASKSLTALLGKDYSAELRKMIFDDASPEQIK
jgi:hypothetical protein